MRDLCGTLDFITEDARKLSAPVLLLDPLDSSLQKITMRKSRRNRPFSPIDRPKLLITGAITHPNFHRSCRQPEPGVSNLLNRTVW